MTLFEKAILKSVHFIYRCSLSKKTKKFVDALSNSVDVQKQILLDILEQNKSCAYALKYGFASIKDTDAFQKSLPLVSYEDIKVYIENMKAGKQNQLVAQKLLLFEKTSGSVSASKYIPVTQNFLAEISNAVSPWIYDLYINYPQIAKTKSYWSISPRLGSQQYTKSGLKIGFNDESEYFGKLERRILKHIFSVDPSVTMLSPEEFRCESAIQILLDEYLGFISIWNPTYFTVMLEYIVSNRMMLADNIRKRKFNRKRKEVILKELEQQTKINFEKIWPNLSLVSCWTEGYAEKVYRKILDYFPHVKIQGKGLLLTEGVISIPYSLCEYPLLAIRSHFYEFIPVTDASNEVSDLKNSKTILAHELEKDRQYIPVITTSSGLYRYITGDCVVCRGFYKNTPMLSFVCRTGSQSDLFGEKLSESFACNAVALAKSRFKIDESFILIAPVLNENPHYRLHIESDAKDADLIEFTNALEIVLRSNHHYDLCRKLGQLYKLDYKKVKNGVASYLDRLSEKRECKKGDIKPSILSRNPFD